MSNVILYILMRSDMDSLNPGKAMAQAAHATDLLRETVATYSDLGFTAAEEMYTEWKAQAGAFGTTIVLDVGSLKEMHELFEVLQPSTSHLIGVVLDPTYPVRDGSVTHLLPVETCMFVLCYKPSFASQLLSEFPLYA